MTVGERIKQKRIELNLSQDELAKKCGYKSRSSIQKIENSRDLPLKKIEQMAKALETTPSYLMGWSEELSPFEKAAVRHPEDEMIQAILKRRTQETAGERYLEVLGFIPSETLDKLKELDETQLNLVIQTINTLYESKRK